MGWSGMVEAEGVLAVAPWMNFRGVLRPGARFKPVPTVIVSGDDDEHAPEMRKTSEILAAAGVPVKLDLRPGMGHHYPDDFDLVLPQLVNWLASHA
jgi:acetyl esterase/lipase